jgi:predicted metalloprotease with PDZ domain
MSNLINTRAGLNSQQEYLTEMAAEMTTVESTPGNRVQPVAEASFDAWIRQYRPNENSRNSQIDYYSKGQLVGLVLDLMIMNATQGAKNHDDVFRVLYDKYYKQLKRGFTDQEYQDAVAEVAGRRFDDFFKNSVYGTKTLPYATALGYAGLNLTTAPLLTEGTLGASFSNRSGKLLVTAVERDGAAWTGGLNVNDEVLQINGAAPGNESVTALAASPVGTDLKLQVKRDGVNRDLTLKTQASRALRYQITPVTNPSAEQQKVMAKWLTSRK